MIITTINDEYVKELVNNSERIKEMRAKFPMNRKDTKAFDHYNMSLHPSHAEEEAKRLSEDKTTDWLVYDILVLDYVDTKDVVFIEKGGVAVDVEEFLTINNINKDVFDYMYLGEVIVNHLDK